MAMSPSTPTSLGRTFHCEDCDKVFQSKQWLLNHNCKARLQPVARDHSNAKSKQANSEDGWQEVWVPVAVASSNIVFSSNDNRAMIVGDIISLDAEEVTLEEAHKEGWEVEVVDNSKAVNVNTSQIGRAHV